MIHVRRVWLGVVTSALAACGNVSEGAAAQRCTDQPPVALKAPRIAGAISVVLLRLATGCDTVVVSNAIPLPPGALQPGPLSRVPLFVKGVAQAPSFAPLPRTH